MPSNGINPNPASSLGTSLTAEGGPDETSSGALDIGLNTIEADTISPDPSDEGYITAPKSGSNQFSGAANPSVGFPENVPDAALNVAPTAEEDNPDNTENTGTSFNTSSNATGGV